MSKESMLETVKASGIPNVKTFETISTVSRSTLREWHKNKRQLFDLVLFASAHQYGIQQSGSGEDR